MRIAIPVAGGKLAAHFGHCEFFALVDVDPNQKKIVANEMIEPPPHEPGLLPRWLAEKGAKLIIAGGMGQRAQNIFTENGITVVIGAPSINPELVVAAWLDGTLQSGENICDH
jgi:predicted Fe-Mo cluster-binding NifX family protein